MPTINASSSFSSSTSSSEELFRFSIDRGGTFTDIYAGRIVLMCVNFVRDTMNFEICVNDDHH